MRRPARIEDERPAIAMTLRIDSDRTHEPAATAADRPHCFVYHITIHNDAELPVTIMGRKWVVRADDGEVTVVEGDGVVGQSPRLAPGEHFTYNSFHQLRTKSAVAEGAYLGLDANGRRVFTRIPAFRMEVPGHD